MLLRKAFCAESWKWVISSYDFEDEATIDLLGTFRIYLFIHIAHKTISLVSQSHKHWRYKDGCPTIFASRSKTGGMITLAKNGLKPKNQKDLQGKISSFLFEKKNQFGVFHRGMTILASLIRKKKSITLIVFELLCSPIWKIRFWEIRVAKLKIRITQRAILAPFFFCIFFNDFEHLKILIRTYKY